MSKYAQKAHLTEAQAAALQFIHGAAATSILAAYKENCTVRSRGGAVILDLRLVATRYGRRDKEGILEVYDALVKRGIVEGTREGAIARMQDTRPAAITRVPQLDPALGDTFTIGKDASLTLTTVLRNEVEVTETRGAKTRQKRMSFDAFRHEIRRLPVVGQPPPRRTRRMHS